MTNALSCHDATIQAELVRRGEMSPLELVDAAIARVEKVNPQLNAMIIPSGGAPLHADCSQAVESVARLLESLGLSHFM
jgi:Asp-tRNA(Asn)/Glu-tRNA(Gln) amidotransferase A subunit family amidase